MDRNSLIGFGLIALLLIAYFQFFAPPPAKDTKAEKAMPSKAAESEALQPASAGPFSSVMTGSEEMISAENSDLALQISSRGFLSSVRLKNFKTYSQQPLLLMGGGNNTFQLKGSLNGQPLDLYSLFYQKNISQKGDTAVIELKADLNGTAVTHTYLIPSKGFAIGYRLQTDGAFSPLSFEWEDLIPLQEKDLQDIRNRTTINYFTSADEFNNLSKTGDEQKSFAENIKWVTIQQKFFNSALIAKKNFSGGYLAIAAAPDPVVKKANVRLIIPDSDLAKGARFDYFFGPNDFDVLKGVTDGFSKNLPLGWPPVGWVNRFVIMPIFKFLQSFIGNYGLIITLMVLIVKLALTPLSYKSYIGMAKMRLLKPELDAIKEKNGDNMAQTQQDQMKLYQQMGVNPFSGCIPLLLQMPFLFAMFFFFPISIDLRQKAFLWAEDLSTYDSIFNLPFSIPFYGSHVSLFVLLMTASQLVYTWQNNQLSSVQGPMKSMSYIMPILFMFILNTFASGLSFYYFISNVVTFAQQAVIRRFVDEDKVLAVMEQNKRNAAAGKGKKSKFIAKLEEAMKTSEEARKKGKK